MAAPSDSRWRSKVVGEPKLIGHDCCICASLCRSLRGRRGSRRPLHRLLQRMRTPCGPSRPSEPNERGRAVRPEAAWPSCAAAAQPLKIGSEGHAGAAWGIRLSGCGCVAARSSVRGGIARGTPRLAIQYERYSQHCGRSARPSVRWDAQASQRVSVRKTPSGRLRIWALEKLPLRCGTR